MKRRLTSEAQLLLPLRESEGQGERGRGGEGERGGRGRKGRKSKGTKKEKNRTLQHDTIIVRGTKEEETGEREGDGMGKERRRQKCMISARGLRLGQGMQHVVFQVSPEQTSVQ